jgi:hypothetical protein
MRAVKEVRVDGRRYIACHNEEQAQKDKVDREAIVAALRERLTRESVVPRAKSEITICWHQGNYKIALLKMGQRDLDVQAGQSKMSPRSY